MQTGTQETPKHTNILRIIKSLMSSHKIQRSINLQPPLLDKLPRRLANRHDILHRNPQLDRLVESLLSNIRNDNPCPDMSHKLQRIPSQPAKTKQEHRLIGLDLGTSSDGMVSCLDCIRGNGRYSGGHTLWDFVKTADVDGCVGGVVAVLADAGVVAVLAYLG